MTRKIKAKVKENRRKRNRRIKVKTKARRRKKDKKVSKGSTACTTSATKRPTSGTLAGLRIFKHRNKRQDIKPNRHEHRIMLCGAGGIGAKSALVIQFLNHQFVTKYDPTIEDTYEKQVMLDSVPVDCVFLDVAGQEEFAALRPQGIRWSEGFIVGYSVTSRSSFESAARWRREILSEKKFRPPMILVGNKIDLKEERQVTTEEGAKMAEDWGCPFIETSCKTRVNIDECVLQLLREITKFRTLGTPRFVSLISPNGTWYSGGVLNNRPHGLGSCEYAEKDNALIERYRGWWENGQRHGTGRCWFRNGRPVQGEWRFGKLHTAVS